MKEIRNKLCLLLIVVMGIFALSGCTLIKGADEWVAEITVIWEEDESVIFDKTIEIAQDKENSVQIPCRPKGFYKVIVNEIKNEEVQRENVFRYPAYIPYEADIELARKKIAVEFIDERKTPTLVLAPNGAIEYKDNDSYVYIYDGNPHFVLPLYCEYEGEKIYFSKYSVLGFSSINEFLGGLVMSGSYDVTIIVDSSDYLKKEDYINYKSAEIEVEINILIQ